VRVAKRDPRLRRRFGIELRAARTRAQLSQEELGHRSGLHATYISQLERGLKSPSLDALSALAGALGTRAHLLVEAAEREQR
jgi:transcriptional regulator with XRE-family HTH domain